VPIIITQNVPGGLIRPGQLSRFLSATKPLQSLHTSPVSSTALFNLQSTKEAREASGQPQTMQLKNQFK